MDAPHHTNAHSICSICSTPVPTFTHSDHIPALATCIATVCCIATIIM